MYELSDGSPVIWVALYENSVEMTSFNTPKASSVDLSVN